MKHRPFEAVPKHGRNIDVAPFADNVGQKLRDGVQTLQDLLDDPRNGNLVSQNRELLEKFLGRLVSILNE